MANADKKDNQLKTEKDPALGSGHLTDDQFLYMMQKMNRDFLEGQTVAPPIPDTPSKPNKWTVDAKLAAEQFARDAFVNLGISCVSVKANATCTTKSPEDIVLAENVLKKLNEKELAELKARPISCRFCEFSDTQLELRKSIAQKVVTILNENENEITDEQRALYDKYPIWGFYQGKDDETIMKRVIGVGTVRKTNEPFLHTILAIREHASVKQTLAKNVSQVSNWSPQQLALLKQIHFPGTFLDPLGILFLFV